MKVKIIKIDDYKTLGEWKDAVNSIVPDYIKDVNEEKRQFKVIQWGMPVIHNANWIGQAEINKKGVLLTVRY